MRESIQARIPDKRNIVTVFAVAMFFVYTWTLYNSFWKLPSWLFFLQMGEILSIYAYAFVVNFMESIILLLITLLPALLLPRQWWTDTFISKGFVFILVILSSAIFHMSLFRTPDTRAVFVSGQPIWWVATLLMVAILTWLAGKVKWMRGGLETVADRFLVFLYIYLPLTALAFLIILARIFL